MCWHWTLHEFLWNNAVNPHTFWLVSSSCNNLKTLTEFHKWDTEALISPGQDRPCASGVPDVGFQVRLISHPRHWPVPWEKYVCSSAFMFYDKLLGFCSEMCTYLPGGPSVTQKALNLPHPPAWLTWPPSSKRLRIYFYYMTCNNFQIVERHGNTHRMVKSWNTARISESYRQILEAKESLSESCRISSIHSCEYAGGKSYVPKD